MRGPDVLPTFLDSLLDPFQMDMCANQTCCHDFDGSCFPLLSQTGAQLATEIQEWIDSVPTEAVTQVKAIISPVSRSCPLHMCLRQDRVLNLMSFNLCSGMLDTDIAAMSWRMPTST